MSEDLFASLDTRELELLVIKIQGELELLVIKIQGDIDEDLEVYNLFLEVLLRDAEKELLKRKST